MDRRCLLALAVLVACAFGAVALRAAPGPKDKPAPPSDRITGTWSFQQESPVVLVWAGGECAEVYWLVFAPPLPTNEFPFINVGDRVTAAGRIGAGGPFKYLVVTSVEKAE